MSGSSSECDLCMQDILENKLYLLRCSFVQSSGSIMSVWQTFVTTVMNLKYSTKGRQFPD